MIQLLAINSTSTYYNNVVQLVRLAFPPNERRTNSHQKLITDCKSNFCCYAILEKLVFVGFVTTWNFDQFVFIEHLAIQPEFRGHKFGSLAVEQILLCNKPVILEVELPSNGNAIRRIEFYSRLGFVAWKNSAYTQPSYKPKGNPVPMLLMNHGSFTESDHFELVRNKIYSEVYGMK